MNEKCCKQIHTNTFNHIMCFFFFYYYLFLDAPIDELKNSSTHKVFSFLSQKEKKSRNLHNREAKHVNFLHICLENEKQWIDQNWY